MKLLDQAKKLPQSHGVYFFIDLKGEPIYIGKATSLRSRVLSYFRDSQGRMDSRIKEMVNSSIRIKFQETDSVLEALILEANLIKKYQPKYNIKEKDDKSFNYIAITEEEFPRLLALRRRDIEKDERKAKNIKVKYLFGPFPQGGSLKDALKIIRKIFPFRDKCLPLSGKACFNRQIGLCPGVCSGEISKEDYAKIIRNIKLFFEGKKKNILRNLKIEMNLLAKNREFEKADIIKNKIFSLNHIQDVALIKDDDYPYKPVRRIRIEAYDVAHISGKFTVGVFTVLEDGRLKKSDYRLFKIKGVKKSDDIASLREILLRRLSHKEWPLPDLIVVDGGKAQKNMAERILRENRLKISVVSVVKDERHRPSGFLGLKKQIDNFKKEILLSNYEAHRFAIGYHKKLRSVI
ncbi:MAG: GIY-YIG nuclease family protein [Parcubacteria group bacterium]|nr:GIY-YIG nuclease family protein [Parcubacteria group bacterium]MCR4342368.1 GIY-YIG nuclease family protein [Patescibacteria group bacterium]